MVNNNSDEMVVMMMVVGQKQTRLEVEMKRVGWQVRASLEA